MIGSGNGILSLLLEAFAHRELLQIVDLAVMDTSVVARRDMPQIDVLAQSPRPHLFDCDNLFRVFH